MTGRALNPLVRVASLLLAWVLLAPAAYAQWTPSGAAGQSTLSLSDPGKALALAAAARVLVVAQDDNRLSVIDPDAGTLLGHVTLPHEPRSVAISADGTRAYVVYGNSKLTAVNVATRTIVGTWTVGGDLRSLVLMPDETELAVADAGPNRLLGVSTTTGAVHRQLSLSHEPREVVRGNGDSKLVVGAVNGWLITVDGGSFSVLAQRKLADEIRSLAWWEAGGRALAVHKRADAVSLIDIAANQVTGTLALDGDPDRPAVAQSSSVGYIATHDDASVNRVDLAGPALLGRYAIAARLNALVFDPAANVLYGALRSDQKLVRLDPDAASLISVLQLQKRLRDVAVNPITHEAVAVADKSDEMFVIRLSDRNVRQIALPARPDLVSLDSTLNRALVAFRGSGPKLRFADLVTNALFAETVDYDRDVTALAVDPTRGLALVITESERPVRVIDINARTHLADGPVDRYRALAIHSGRGVAYLATEDRTLKVMDLATRAVTATLELGFRANAIAVDEALDKAVITTDTGNRAHVLNLATLALETSHVLPNHPAAVSLQADTHVAVIASRESDRLSLLDLASNTLTSGFTSLEKPHALAVSARYNEAVVLSGERDEVVFAQLPNPVPALDTLSPAQAAAGSGAFVLTLNGRGFVDASRAFFGGTPLATRWLSATRLEADVPAALLATPGSVPVTVQNPAPAGGASNALTFSVLGAPTLTAVVPNSALADGQPKALALSGQNFASGATVLFGTTVLSATVQSSSSIALVVPGVLTGTPGVVQVSVVNPGGLASNSLPFTLAPVLAINAVTPASAEVGAIITLAGTGFDPVPSSNALLFRGINNTTVPAAALTATPSAITVRVPPLAESGPITLTNSRGTAQSPPFTVLRDQNYDLVVSPASVGVFQAASNSAQVQLSSTGTKPYTGLVTLSVQGLPSGVTASFEPAATLSAFQTGTITFAAATTAAPGSHSLTVTAAATEGGQNFTRSAPMTLTVQSAAGVTGVKGRFVTPEGNGIGGVIVRADIATNPQPQATTDAAGNFVLAGLPAGTVTFRFDATPANPLYPIWPYTMTVVANQVSVISDWTINPPPSDDKFVAIANATQDQSITDARFPGLEITLPAGVTITGWDGVVKSRIAVERIMPDKLPVSAPPFPMREAYQLYFGTPMGGIPSQPIPVTLPNVAEREPGEQVEIWFFDGSPMGGSGEWKLAGLGTVSPDGKTVASNPGVGIPRFCGVCGLLSLSCPPPPNPPQPPPDGCPVCGKPVDLFTGQELMTMGLLGLDGRTPIDLSLKYNPVDAYNNRAGTVTSFGFGWAASYDIGFLPFAGPQKRLVMPGGKFVNFVDDGSGTYKPFDDPGFDGAVITATNAAASEWQLRLKSGMIWRFKPFAGIPGVIRGGPPTFLTEIVDQMGNSLSIARLSNGRIASIGTPERHLRMTYGTNGFVSEVTDSANRTMRFTYTASNRLQTVTDADDKVGRYTYVDDSEIPVDAACSPQETMGERIKTVLFPGRLRATENFYGAGRRVLRQVGHDGREFRIAYKLTGACVTHVSNPGVKCTASCPDVDSWENFQAGWRIHGGRVVGTTVKNPNGTVTSHSFGAKGTVPSFNNAEGQPTRIKYDKSNRPVEITDAFGRTRKMQYDELGNAVRVTDPLGRNTDFVYDERWGKHTRVTRYLPDSTPVVMQDAYDSAGRRIRMTDPLGNVTTYSYTPRGELASVTVPGNRISTFTYNAPGDLVRMTNPLGGEVAFETDGAGRPVTITDPLGFNTRMESNGRDDVTKFIDALQGETRYVFDDGYRLTSVIDPRNNPVESYQYDDQDRLAAKLDAFSKASRYEYDSAGRLSRFTDRKGQATDFTFDANDRAIRKNYAGVVQTLTYDAAGRITEIREPDNAVSYAYDLADRVVTARTDTANGRIEIGYEYDTLDRVVRRTLNGGDPTDYTYDKAGRLLTVVYRGRTTQYEWDELGRLTSKTLPGGIRQTLQHDDAGRVTQIQYVRPDGAVIETIAYQYDAKGQRISKSTSSPSIQETPIVAVYNAGNRLANLTVSGRTFLLAYDDNGNLLSRTDQGNPSDVTTYSWDARNRLAGIAGPGAIASFVYDVLGRRTAKTVNGITTSFLYDGTQAIAETAGAASKAILSGLAVDEVIARYSDAGERSYLTDALGSVIAQAKADHSIQSFYSYTPYGEASALGDDEGNSIQYTGRENDLTGLYFYRARYYDPVLKRFITEDPIGLGAGINVYAYVSGAPTLATDPSGQCVYLGTFFIRKETEHLIIKGKGYIRSESWPVPDYTHWECHFFPPTPMHRYLPPCLPRIVWKTWDLHELGSKQWTNTYELWEAWYMCNPTCDNLADVRIPVRRNESGWKLTWDDLRYEWIPR